MQSLVDTPPEDIFSKQSTPVADQDINGSESPAPVVLKPSQKPNLMDEWDNQVSL